MTVHSPEPAPSDESRPATAETAIAPITACRRCGADLSASSTWARLRVCSQCRYHGQLSARRRLDILLDEGTFREVHQSLSSVDPLVFSDRVPYSARLEEARQKTSLDDAVIIGTGRVNGRECVLAVLDFEFMGGSMGTVVGEKVALAVELAIDRRLPFISVAASGGARMQEGMLSLVQMAKTAAATTRLSQAGLPFISVLTDPTTGGVYASFASRGDVILAEPGALIGFAGPRVIEQLTGRAKPKDAQTAEYLLANGQIDGVVDRARLRNVLATILQLWHTSRQATPRTDGELYRPETRVPASAWEAVELARHPDRPTSRDYIRVMLPHFVELHGDRRSQDDPAVICGIGDLGGVTVMLIAQERGRGEEERQKRHGGRMGAEGYQKAARALRLAGAWGLPVLTLIDTPGAALDFDSEARGLAPSIAQCLATMSIVPTPIVAVVIGEGGSGGALALGVADRILMQENSIYSVIAPEGAAAILYHDAHRARDLADALKLTAADCKMLGVVDTLVPEPEGGAHLDADYAALLVRNFVLDALVDLHKTRPQRLVEERYRKFRRMGQQPSGSRREAFARDMDQLQKRVGSALGQVLDLITSRDEGSRETSEAAEEEEQP
ncbi:MAG: acetyl-CoA carboxylase, carboxyltransferase subunit beta [Chloroflexi bacterium]|nr:acetyl-CoA carboxylase, carboxyltransferase subunit beta [Chloroflexota bacterium]